MNNESYELKVNLEIADLDAGRGALHTPQF